MTRILQGKSTRLTTDTDLEDKVNHNDASKCVCDERACGRCLWNIPGDETRGDEREERYQVDARGALKLSCCSRGQNNERLSEGGEERRREEEEKRRPVEQGPACRASGGRSQAQREEHTRRERKEQSLSEPQRREAARRKPHYSSDGSCCQSLLTTQSWHSCLPSLATIIRCPSVWPSHYGQYGTT